MTDNRIATLLQAYEESHRKRLDDFMSKIYR
jgi:hypothetical protein